MARLHVALVVTRAYFDGDCPCAALDWVVVVRDDDGQEIGAHLMSVIAIPAGPDARRVVCNQRAER